jgi:hypothetical protein
MQLKPHEMQNIREGNYRFLCSACGQKWTRWPSLDCPGIPVFGSWEEVPEGYYSMTRMEREFHRTTDWSKPHAAKRDRRAPYLLELYHIDQCEPIPIDPVRSEAAKKGQQRRQQRYTCLFCKEYQRHRWQQKKFHHDITMCDACYTNIELWNKQVEWARERVAENAQVCYYRYSSEGIGLSRKRVLREVEILRMDGLQLYQASEFDPDVFFPILMQSPTVIPPDCGPNLFYVCPDTEKYPYWQTPYWTLENGLPLVCDPEGGFIDVTWRGREIYRLTTIPDPYLYLCQLWGIEVDKQTSKAEKMRRAILKAAEAGPIQIRSHLAEGVK